MSETDQRHRLTDSAIKQAACHRELEAKNRRWWWLRPAWGPTPAEEYHRAAAREYIAIARCADNAAWGALGRCLEAKERLDRVTALMAQFGDTPPAEILARLVTKEGWKD